MAMCEPRKTVGHRHPYRPPGWYGVFWRYSEDQEKTFTVDVALPTGVVVFNDSEEAQRWEQEHQMIFRTTQPP